MNLVHPSRPHGHLRAHAQPTYICVYIHTMVMINKIVLIDLDGKKQDEKLKQKRKCMWELRQLTQQT